MDKFKKFRPFFRYIIGIILLAQEFMLEMWHVYIGDFDFGEHLPFHLCGLAIIFSALTMFTKNYTLYEIIYFWGLGGGIQAIITPDLDIYSFPHYRYFQLFLSHGLIFVTVFYMTIVEKYRPYFKSIFRVILITIAALITVSFINILTNGNYMFICRKPQTASLLDFFGPWPYYLIGIIISGIVTYFIVYLPFLFIDLYKNRKINDIKS
jgi:hypothetical integral membrane protein (TIGR02206 family)